MKRSKTTLFILMGLSTAFLLAVPVIILLFIGLFFDNIFHTSPWLVIIGIIIGFGGGIMNVFKLMKAFNKKENKKL